MENWLVPDSRGCYLCEETIHDVEQHAASISHRITVAHQDLKNLFSDPLQAEGKTRFSTILAGLFDIREEMKPHAEKADRLIWDYIDKNIPAMLLLHARERIEYLIEDPLPTDHQILQEIHRELGDYARALAPIYFSGGPIGALCLGLMIKNRECDRAIVLYRKP